MEDEIQRLQREIAEHPNYIQLYKDLGDRYFDAGMFEEAVAAWRAGYDLYGDVYVDEREESNFVWTRVAAMEARGDMERSIERFRAAPASPQYHDLFLHFFFLLGQYATACIPAARLDEMRARAASYVESGRKRAYGHYLTGVCDASEGRLDEAIAAFETCRQVATDSEEHELRIDAALAFTRAVADFVRNASAEWTAPSARSLRLAPRPTPLERFAEIGLSQDEASAWLRTGLDSKGARPWLAARFSPQQAAEFHSRGVPVEVAVVVRDLGMPAAYGSVFRDSTVVADWRERGFAIAEGLAWANTGVAPREAADWRDAGFDVARAARWRRDGVAPETAAAWRDAGLEPEEASEWRARGFDAADGTPWRRLGFDAETAGRWRVAAFNAETAAAWRRAGFTRAAVARWRAFGFAPDAAAERRRAGLDAAAAFDAARAEGGALLFFGASFPLRSVPWPGRRREDRRWETWPARFARNAPRTPLEPLGCKVGLYGDPAAPSSYVALVRFEATATPGPVPVALVPPGPDELSALNRFSRALGARHGAPGWWLASLGTGAAALFWGIVFDEPGAPPWIAAKRVVADVPGCSVGAAGGVHYVAAGGSVLLSPPASQVAVPGFEVAPEWGPRLEAFCDLMGIARREPAWWLAARR